MSGFRYFAIFGVMRTGSNLLEQTLKRYDGIAALGELFNRHFIGGPKTEEAFGTSLSERNLDPIGFLNRVIAAHPGQIPGFRIFVGHDARMMSHAARDPECARIVLSRNPLDSFLSLKIAQETGQWMLGKEENRRLAKVTFDPSEFETYREETALHYAHVRRMIREAGHSAFEIGYDELEDLDLINGLAAHIAGAPPLERLPRKILRQNPVDPRDRVTNPDALTTLGTRISAAPAEPRPTVRGLDAVIVHRGADTLFVPIPGACDDATMALLAASERLNGGEVKESITGLKPTKLVRRRRRGTFVFAFVKEPIARALAVYQEVVRGEGHPDFQIARALLESDYGVPDGWTDAPETGLDAYLTLLEDCLAGRAPLPLNPAWAPQSTILADLSQETPVDFVGRAERAEADAAYILERIGTPDPTLATAFSEAVSAPPFLRVTKEQAVRLRTIYSRDYQRLGFPRAE